MVVINGSRYIARVGITKQTGRIESCKTMWEWTCVLCSRATPTISTRDSGAELPGPSRCGTCACRNTTLLRSPNPVFCRHTNGNSKRTASPFALRALSLRKAFDPQVAHCDSPVSPEVRHPLSNLPVRTFKSLSQLQTL